MVKRKRLSTITTFDAVESQNALNKTARKHNYPSVIKKQAEWALTPEGQAYYKRRLNRI